MCMRGYKNTYTHNSKQRQKKVIKIQEVKEKWKPFQCSSLDEVFTENIYFPPNSIVEHYLSKGDVIKTLHLIFYFWDLFLCFCPGSRRCLGLVKGWALLLCDYRGVLCLVNLWYDPVASISGLEGSRTIHDVHQLSYLHCLWADLGYGSKCQIFQDVFMEEWSASACFTWFRTWRKVLFVRV